MLALAAAWKSLSCVELRMDVGEVECRELPTWAVCCIVQAKTQELARLLGEIRQKHKNK